MSEKRKQITAAIVTAAIVAWLIITTGCGTVPACDPMYGPHVMVTKSSHEWDIERRNAYTDGWDQRDEAERLIRDE